MEEEKKEEDVKVKASQDPKVDKLVPKASPVKRNRANLSAAQSGKITPKVNIFKKTNQELSATKKSNMEEKSDFDGFSVVVDPGKEPELLSKADLENIENNRG